MSESIRLIYPQWQGGVIASWIPKIPAADSARGYYLGAMLLDFLAPETEMRSFTVPISTEYHERKVTDGITDKEIILKQTKAALDILNVADADKVVTLGGECSVSVPVFTWLNKKYADDLAVVWFDQHPDVTLPTDEYTGYHAMALTACMGMGDKDIISLLPSKISSKNVCIAGIRDYEHPYIEKRVNEFGMARFTDKELSKDSTLLLNWINSTGKKKVLIHFDMDVLDPTDIVTAVADTTAGGLKLQEVVRIINEIANEFNLVSLTVAEPMPRIAIRLKRMLADLPLIR
ncbi:MAG: arginase family protein [Paramuribaculum sp.]|nr:arginase family protein [Paramuribaculum sp.]